MLFLPGVRRFGEDDVGGARGAARSRHPLVLHLTTKDALQDVPKEQRFAIATTQVGSKRR
ncbi:MAG: hypothetical protein R2713_16480 [Ilumatobacteraceae bacterium]